MDLVRMIASRELKFITTNRHRIENHSMAKKSKLTPTRVSIKLASGKTTTGIRHKNLVPAPSALTPPAGPAHDSLTSPLVGKIAATEEHPEFDPETGLDARGWTRNGLHCWTQDGRSYYGKYDAYGRDRDGYSVLEKPLDDLGFTPRGFDVNDFDRSGIHRETGTELDLGGRDRHGFYGVTGLPILRPCSVNLQHNPAGFGPDGFHRDTGMEFDDHGFDWNHIHPTTGTRFDERGFSHDGQTRDYTGIDADGRDFRGYGPDRRDAAGNHFLTGTPLDSQGFDAAGINATTGTRLDAWGSAKIKSSTDTFDQVGDSPMMTWEQKLMRQIDNASSSR